MFNLKLVSTGARPGDRVPKLDKPAVSLNQRIIMFKFLSASEWLLPVPVPGGKILGRGYRLG